MGAQRVERKLVLMGNGGKARGSTNSRAMQKFQKQIDRGMPPPGMSDEERSDDGIIIGWLKKTI